MSQLFCASMCLFIGRLESLPDREPLDKVSHRRAAGSRRRQGAVVVVEAVGVETEGGKLAFGRAEAPPARLFTARVNACPSGNVVCGTRR
jgi:hypothetical protein